jgi:hypothetical protein
MTIQRTEEYRERLSKAAKEMWSRPGTREKMKRSRDTPMSKEKMSKSLKIALAKPEVKAKMSNSLKIALAKPEVKERMSGSNNGRWNGGSSYKPYCIKFNNQLKDEIRRKFEYKCYLCPHVQGERKLCIHHVDYNKNTLCDGRKWPLIPLCDRCHGKTNSNRWYWFSLLMNYWALNPEINLDQKVFNL